MDRLQAESYLLEVIAGQLNMSLNEYLVSLGQRELARMERELPGEFNSLMEDLGRQVYQGGFDSETEPPTSEDSGSKLPPNKKRCPSCNVDMGFRSFDGDSDICRRCTKAREPKPAGEDDPEGEDEPGDGLKKCFRCGVNKLPNGFFSGAGDVCIVCYGGKPGAVFLCSKCDKMKDRSGFRDGVCKACR